MFQYILKPNVPAASGWGAKRHQSAKKTISHVRNFDNFIVIKQTDGILDLPSHSWNMNANQTRHWRQKRIVLEDVRVVTVEKRFYNHLTQRAFSCCHKLITAMRRNLSITLTRWCGPLLTMLEHSGLKTVKVRPQNVKHYLICRRKQPQHSTTRTTLHFHLDASSAATTRSVLSHPQQNNIWREITSHEQT